MIHLSSMRHETIVRIANAPDADALLATPYALSLPHQATAQRVYAIALRRGKIVPPVTGCSAVIPALPVEALPRSRRDGYIPEPRVCGSVHRLSGHHEDYRHPLDVVWLCAMHHAGRHSELRSQRIHLILHAREYLAAHVASEAA